MTEKGQYAKVDTHNRSEMHTYTSSSVTLLHKLYQNNEVDENTPLMDEKNHT